MKVFKYLAVVAALAFHCSAHAQALSILNQPTSTNVAVGATGNFFNVSVVGASPTFQWYHELAPIATGSNYILLLTNVTLADAGNYSVVVSNYLGSITSSPAAKLNVLVVPAVTNQPVATNLAAGGTINLIVGAAGDTNTYFWRKNVTNNLSNGANGNGNGGVIAGARTATFSISNATNTDSGSYSVLVSNAVGSVISTNVAVIVVNAPVITNAPASKTIAISNSYTFTVGASGSLLNYLWLTNGGVIPGKTNSSLVLTNIALSDALSYQAVVTNLYSSVTSSPAASLTVLNPITVATPLLGTNVATNTTFTLSASVTGDLPVYQWKHGATNIACTNSIYTNLLSQLTDAGAYSVVVSNAISSITLGPVTVNVVSLPGLSTDLPANKYAAVGSNVTLSVTVSNSTLVTYQWWTNTVLMDGANSNSLPLTAVSTSDNGTYSVVVSNIAGSVTSTVANLSVLVPLAITAQPVSTNLSTNGVLRLSVATTGDSPLYQWKKGGSNIVGATFSTFSTYTNSTPLPGDSGVYSVSVTNGLGGIVSSNITVNVVALPGISVQPVSKSVALGSAYTTFVVVSNSSLVSYQWLFNSNAIPSATATNLNLTSLVATNEGYYNVVVTNLSGSVTSSPAYLTILTPPAIQTQPGSTNVVVGHNFTLGVQATGGSLGYKWRAGTNILGSTSATVTVSAAQTTDSGNYTVVITNAIGTVTSAVSVVQVVASPVVLIQPISRALVLGTNYTLSIGMQDPNTSLLNYEWRQNGTAIYGGTSSNLTLTAVTTNDAGSYTVQITNIAGVVTSSVASILVQMPPVITRAPMATNLATNQTLTLTVAATGDDIGYKWYFSTNLLVGSSSTYTLPNAQTNHTGNYSVTVTNAVGQVSSAPIAVYVVSTPAIATQPVGTNLFVGDKYTLSVAVSNAVNSLLSYQWQFNGSTLAGATNSTLTLDGVGADFSGNYSVLVTNIAGSTLSSNAVISVVTFPAITAQPTSTNLPIHSNLVLSVTATGSLLNYQWFKEGRPVLGQTSNTLNVANVGLTDSATYKVLVTNVLGSVTSSEVIVNVIPPPAINDQPADQTVSVWSDCSFSVTVSNNVVDSFISYQWMYESNVITGATGPSYSLYNVAPERAGNYSVLVTTLAGSTLSSNALLTVVDAPLISSQPLSTNLVAGGALDLSVVASGGGLFYAWYQDTNLLSSTSNRVSINVAGHANSGVYSVVVSNLVGTVLSSNAVVYVVDQPSITNDLTNVVVSQWDTYTYSIGMSNADTSLLYYQWKLGGADIPDATNSTYTLSAIQFGDAGSYSVVVTNLAGSTNSLVSALTVLTPPVISVQPLSTNLATNGILNLSVTASGGNLTYEWYQDSTLLSNVPPTSSSIVFTSSDVTNSGSYFVVVYNTAGTAVSSNAVVNVVAKPSFQTNLPANLTLLEWDPYTFRVDMTNAGTSLLSYQWYVNSNAVAGATANTLYYQYIRNTDIGTYFVVVTNYAGSVTSVVNNLNVLSLPVVTVQPISTNVFTNGAINLSVTATGNNLSYQWVKDGVKMPGKTTNVLTIASATITNSGDYTVVISNAVGRVTGGPAHVVAVVAPLIFTQPVDVITEDYVGSALFFVQVTNVNNALCSFQWYKGVGALLNETNSSVLLDQVSTNDNGLYSVTVSNIAGVANSTAGRLTVQAGPVITVQPASTNLVTGSNLVLTVTAQGDSLDYYWFKDGSPVGTNGPAYGLTGATTNASGLYTVTVTNNIGQDTSVPGATVYVVDVPGISTVSNTVFVVTGTAYDLVVDVTNAANSALHYQWISNSVAWDPTTTPLAGATTNVLHLLNTSAGTNYYGVIVTNIAGAVTNAIATVVVQSVPIITDLNGSGGNIAVVTNFPVGSNLDLTVVGTSAIGYRWYYGATFLSDTNELVISNAQMSASGTYTVHLTNDAGVTISSNIDVQVVAAPVIRSGPQGGVKIVGTNHTFGVTMLNTNQNSFVTYQWVAAATNDILVATNITSATANFLTFNNLTVDRTGWYSVVVSNMTGVVTNKMVNLIVENVPAIAISGQPHDTNVGVGRPLVLNLTATGELLTYQWRFSTNPIPNGTNTIVGAAAKLDNYTNSNAQLTNTGYYSVVVTNGVGSVTSSIVHVTVVNPPAIQTQPATPNGVFINSNFTFSVVASNADSSLLSYQWYTNSGAGLTNPINGATTNTYTVTNAQLAHAGTYRVVITNVAGSVTSTPVILNIQDTITISSQPSDLVIVTNDAIILNVVASGGGLGFQWYQNNTNAVAGATANTLTINNAQLSQAGNYSVVITNSISTLTSTNAKVMVLATPVISAQPAGKTLAAGANFTFNVGVANAGSQLVSYQWMFNTNVLLVGKTTNSCTMSTLSNANAGYYSVVVSNLAGSVTSAPVMLTVLDVVSINTQPTNIVAATNNDIVLSVAATGGGLKYQWRKNVTNILSGATSDTLTLTNAQVVNAGIYSVVVTNSFSSATSSNAQVWVLAGPKITSQPLSQLQTVGKTNTFSVSVLNATNLMLSYQWIKGTTNYPDATNISFVLKNLTTNHSGSYSVVVSNIAGVVTSSVVTLTVQGIPVITTQPDSTNLVIHGDINLSVEANGGGMRYQWRRSNTNLVAKTNSTLLITNALARDSGQYSVIVSNVLGAVPSQPATVWVVSAPVITNQPVATVLVAALKNYTFRVGVSNTALVSYQWKFGGVEIDSATNSSLTLSKLDVTNTGTYSVTVTNLAGTNTSSGAILTVLDIPVITAQPVSTNVGLGQSIVLNVASTGGQINYKWRKGTNSIALSNTNQFVITNAQIADAGSYFVDITNGVGKVTSSNATVRVLSRLSFLTQPTNNITVGFGTNTTLAATVSNAANLSVSYRWLLNSNVIAAATNNTWKASGDALSVGYYQIIATNIAGSITSRPVLLTLQTRPVINAMTAATNLASGGAINLAVGTSAGELLSYQWSRGSTILKGITNSSMTVASAVVSNSALYSVTITNYAGAVTTNVQVTVVGIPKITTQPLNRNLLQGSNTTLSVVVSNAASSLLHYQWSQITNGVTNLVGLSTNILTLLAVDASNIGGYQVIVTNLAGSATSTVANVTVQTTPNITLQPLASVILTNGATLNLTAAANGTWLSNQWTRGTVVVGTNGPSLTITNMNVTNSGTYKLTVTNSVGKTNTIGSVVLVVVKPTIQTQPVGKVLSIGGTYTLTVAASNAVNQALSYQWRTNGIEMTGYTTNSVVLPNVTTNDTASYTVVITNIAGSITSAVARVIVQDKPVITVQPVGTNIVATSNLVLNVTASGTTPGYQWMFNTTNKLVGQNSAQLNLLNAQTTNSGNYSVVVTNANGTNISTNVIVWVVARPTVSTNMALVYNLATGSNLTLSVTASNASKSLLSYQWTKDGVNLGGNSTTNTFKILGAEYADGGDYALVITNIAGSVTSRVSTVTVMNPVVITVQPVQPKIGTTIGTITVTNGANLDLNVTATGDNLFYQWKRTYTTGSWTNLMNATNSTLSFTNIQTTNAGPYIVVVSNAVGSVTSYIAQVTVLKKYDGVNWVPTTNAVKPLLTAKAVATPGAGDYNGLFSSSSSASAWESVGSVSLTVSPTLAYSGKLMVNGDSIGISGQFSTDGKDTFIVQRANGKSDLTVTLALDVPDKQIAGTIGSGAWTSSLAADLVVYATAGSAPEAGTYIMEIPSLNGSATGVATVTANGVINFVGNSADGVSLAQSVAVSKDGFWPFFVQLSNGEIAGWIQFDNGVPTGTLNWIEANGSVSDSQVSVAKVPADAAAQ